MSVCVSAKQGEGKKIGRQGHGETVRDMLSTLTRCVCHVHGCSDRSQDKGTRKESMVSQEAWRPISKRSQLATPTGAASPARLLVSVCASIAKNQTRLERTGADGSGNRDSIAREAGIRQLLLTDVASWLL